MKILCQSPLSFFSRCYLSIHVLSVTNLLPLIELLNTKLSWHRLKKNLIPTLKMFCNKTGFQKNFNFIIKENPPPADINMSDTIACTAWSTNKCSLTYGNGLIDSSQATIENLQEACDSICNHLKS